MHPITWLAFGTFILVVAFLVWNRVSTQKHRFNSTPSGVGGPSDPLAGARGDLRSPDSMRASLDAAAERPSPADRNLKV